MKKITNFTKQEIYLEGFGTIEIKDNGNSEWLVDFFPADNMNREDNMIINMCRNGSGCKYFESLAKLRERAEERINEVYGN